MRAGGAVQAGERPTRLAHQDVESREIPYRYLRLGGDVGRALGHQAIGQEVAVGALRTAGGMLANPWLFPSRRPGKHLDAISLVIGLGNAGIATPHPSWNPFDETGRSGSTHREKCVVAQRPWTILHPPIAERDAMTNHTYRVIEIVGTSPGGIDAAIRNGLARAAETTRGLDWFEVQSVRGHLEDGPVAHFQVTLKVGFRLEDA